MMRETTINNLKKVSKFMLDNAHYAMASERIEAKQPNLFELLKYAVRKECNQLSAATGINCSNIIKTPRQFNWLANETEYGLRKMMRKNDGLRIAWEG